MLARPALRNLVRTGVMAAVSFSALAACAQTTAPGSGPGRFWNQPDPSGLLRTHDPATLVREGGEFWSFVTGPGVPSRRAKDLEHWNSGPPVWSSPPPWVKEFLPGHNGFFWAPDVVRINGRWCLYYSVSTWGKNTSAIALASTPTLDPAAKEFGWRDDGVVLQSARTNDFNAIDPAVFRDVEGRLWLAFGSFWSGIKMTALDPATGKLLQPGAPLTALAWHKEIEAPALAAHDGWYFLFVNWGLCCRGTNSTYEIRMGRSRAVTGPYMDREGRDLMAGGGTLFLGSEGRLLGPGHAGFFQEGTNSLVSFHFYDRDRRGAQTLGIRKLSWNADGWPVAGGVVFPRTPVETARPSGP